MIYGAAEQVAAPFVRPVQTALAAAAEMVGGPRARRAWRGDERCWIEVRGLQGGDGQQIGAAVLRSLARDPAVHRARLNYPLSRVIVEIDPEADPAADTLPRLCDLVARAETGVAAQPEAAQPGDLPGDGILLALKAITVAASGIGIGVAAVGRT